MRRRLWRFRDYLRPDSAELVERTGELNVVILGPDSGMLALTFPLNLSKYP